MLLRGLPFALALAVLVPPTQGRTHSRTHGARVSASGPVAAAADETPVLPLPRMPGSVRLASATERDDGGQWRITASFRVNAHVHHVLAFYRKALADAGLQVDELAPADDAALPVLRGRSERIHARIDLTTKPGELETRIWILWHVLRE